MKASKLIEKLAVLIGEVGDLDVVVDDCDDGDCHPVETVKGRGDDQIKISSDRDF